MMQKHYIYKKWCRDSSYLLKTAIAAQAVSQEDHCLIF